MSITDELREWAKALTHWWYDPVKDQYTYTTDTMPPSIDAIRLDSRILAIADRIDAEHEQQLVEARAEGMQEGFAADKGPRGFVELPKDADNVPWNVGDCDEDGNEVIALKLATDGWYVVTVGEWPYRPEHKRHHHAPTVEDVLREVIDKATNSTYTICDILSEYAAKLRLAEEEDA